MKISETRDISACRTLRRTVFIEEQGVSEADEIDDLDEKAHHLLASDGDRPIGSARILILGDTAKIGRVCVLREERGRGVGAELIRAALALIADVPGVTVARLGAQTHALGFYEKLGFVAHGPVYDDAGFPHRDMERRV